MNSCSPLLIFSFFIVLASCGAEKNTLSDKCNNTEITFVEGLGELDINLYVAFDDLGELEQCSEESNKPILNIYSCWSCMGNRHAEWKPLSDSQSNKFLRKNYLIRYYHIDDDSALPRNMTSKRVKTKGDIFYDKQVARYRSNVQPMYTITDADGNDYMDPIGYVSIKNIDDFRTFIEEGYRNFKDSNTRNPFSEYSTSKLQDSGFSPRRAINRVVNIENEYYEDRRARRVSRYYGTEWRKLTSQKDPVETSFKLYTEELSSRGLRPDSMHCTIYAFESLKAGLDSTHFSKLTHKHKEIWKTREYAGWSLGHILVNDFNWKAYLIIDSLSSEYDHCMKAYSQSKSYPVWRQPDIKLTDFFVLGKDDNKISKLLSDREFGFGFSEQGIHTWITRFEQLKECYWTGSPSVDLDLYPGANQLFLKTRFLEYEDYLSHVVIFPE